VRTVALLPATTVSGVILSNGVALTVNGNSLESGSDGIDTTRPTGPADASKAKVTVAVNVVVLTKVVDNGAPFRKASAWSVKFCPVMVISKSAHGGYEDVGLIDVSTGAGWSIVKLRAAEVLPLALLTVTEAEPSEARSGAGMVAVSVVELTKVVVIGEPFQRIVAPDS
jgi:hypothetical protein